MRKALILLFVLGLAWSPAVAQSFGGDDDAPGARRTVVGAAALSAGASATPMIAGAVLWHTQEGAAQVAGAGLVVLGYVLGPSVGSVYLDDRSRALTGLAIRGAGVGALVGGVVLGFGGVTRDENALAFSSGLISLSAIVVPYGLAYNFTTLSESHGEMQLRLTAAVDRESGSMVPALVLRF